MRIKKICAAKATINRVKGKPQNGKKYCKSHI